MKKTLITSILSIIIIIIISTIFFTKNTIDKKASEIVKQELPIILEELKSELESLNISSNVSYNDVIVSSTGGHLLLDGVNISELNGDNFYFDEIKIGTSYKELLSIIKNKNFDQINSFFLEFKNFNIVKQLSSVNSGQSNQKIANNIKLEFNGRLTKDMINNIQYELPNEKQNLKINVQGFNFPDDDEFLFEIEEFVKNFDSKMLNTDFSFSLDYFPKKNQFSINNIYSKNELGKFEGGLIFKYSGNKIDDIEIINVSANGKSKGDYRGITIGDEEISLNLGTGDIDFNFNINGDIYNMNEDEILNNILGSIDLSFKEFELIPSRELARDIQRLFFGFKLKNNKLNFSNIGGNLSWDGKDLETSIDISSSLASLISNLKMDINFNREGEPFLENFRFNGKSNFDFDNMKLGDEEVSLGLGRGDAVFDFSINGDLENMNEVDIIRNMDGEYQLNLNNFKIKLADYMIDDIRRDLNGFSLKNNEISLKNYNQDFKWDGDKLINNMDVSTSLGTLKSDIDMILKLDRTGNPDIFKSKLNKCVLRLGNLDKNILQIVEDFENEMLMGQSLPRKGNEIILDVSGTFANPKIDGLNF